MQIATLALTVRYRPLCAPCATATSTRGHGIVQFAARDMVQTLHAVVAGLWYLHVRHHKVAVLIAVLGLATLDGQGRVVSVLVAVAKRVSVR